MSNQRITAYHGNRKYLKEKYCLYILEGREHLRGSGLDERSVEPEKQPLLGKGSATTFVSRQRPRNTKARRPLLSSRLLKCKNRRSLLGDGSVNKFLRQRIRMQKRNSVFYVVYTEMFKARDKISGGKPPVMM
jgi:hypothetical protein